MHFWSGVSAIAGALRRRVWIDMGYFKWHANHYIVFVAPPGIVSKSTTVSIAMSLLRKVPGVKFGPDVVTWPALVTGFAEASELFEFNSEWYTQCALTLESSEFGNLVNPQDREMIDLLVNLWDAKQGEFKKITKGSGTDTVENPWINLIACTTPAWIAGNFPEYVIGGGFTSRCLFVYAEEKERFVAYPSQHIPAGQRAQADLLVQDLEHIATNLMGPYTISDEGMEWGEVWYKHHYDHPPELLQDERFGGYLARKQTHLHKLAMVIAAAQRDLMEITVEDLSTAGTMIDDLEKDMPKVFSKIGRTTQSIQAERLIKFVRKNKLVSYDHAYQHVYEHFPLLRDYSSVFDGAVRAGYIQIINTDRGLMVAPKDIDDSLRGIPSANPT